jgi:hypothetical protein
VAARAAAATRKHARAVCVDKTTLVASTGCAVTCATSASSSSSGSLGHGPSLRCQALVPVLLSEIPLFSIRTPRLPSRMIFRAAIVSLFLIQAARADPPTDPVAVGRIRYAPLLNAAAAQYSLPSALADAVATVESAYEPGARGAAGEVGLMQVRPSTAAMLGFQGSLEQLADPATNIRLGVKYLAGAWVVTGGRLCDTLMKYRAGYGEDSMSLRSVTYCRRARDYLASIGSPLATGPAAEIPPITPAMLTADALNRPPHVGAPMFLTPAAMIRLRHGKLTAEDTRQYWIAEKAYIRTLRSRLELACRALHKRRVCPIVITRFM